MDNNMNSGLKSSSQQAGRVLTIPADKAAIADIHAGELVYLTGTMLVGRDQVHKRLHAIVREGKAFPVPISGELLYYMGPAPAPPGFTIGSCGPTTAARMDTFTPELLDLGLLGTIGKGPRSTETAEAIRRNGSIYFYAFGGCGALYASCIVSSRIIAFEDLGPEALYRLEVKDFPVIAAVDCQGCNIYSSCTKKTVPEKE